MNNQTQNNNGGANENPSKTGSSQGQNDQRQGDQSTKVAPGQQQDSKGGQSQEQNGADRQKKEGSQGEA